MCTQARQLSLDLIHTTLLFRQALDDACDFLGKALFVWDLIREVHCGRQMHATKDRITFTSLAKLNVSRWYNNTEHRDRDDTSSAFKYTGVSIDDFNCMSRQRMLCTLKGIDRLESVQEVLQLDPLATEVAEMETTILTLCTQFAARSEFIKDIPSWRVTPPGNETVKLFVAKGEKTKNIRKLALSDYLKPNVFYGGPLSRPHSGGGP